MENSTPAVSMVQAAAILARLERRDVSPSSVRTALVLGPTSRAMQPGQRGKSRLFTAVDLACFRLMLRLRDEGISPVVSRVIVSTLREGLALHWQHNDPMALAVVGMQGLITYASENRPPYAVAWVDLRTVWRGLEHAIAAATPERPARIVAAQEAVHVHG
jgi:hypothetical protein